MISPSRQSCLNSGGELCFDHRVFILLEGCLGEAVTRVFGGERSASLVVIGDEASLRVEILGFVSGQSLCLAQEEHEEDEASQRNACEDQEGPRVVQLGEHGLRVDRDDEAAGPENEGAN